MNNIVISAVNLRKGGTLTILRSCLSYLSGEAVARRMTVTALVHDRRLCDYPGIDYIEMPGCIRGWGRRLRAEYVTMRGISRRIAAEKGPIDLWLSLHDTSPRVVALRQAVYCQTSFPFYRWSLRDFRMDYKIPLFALLTRYAYRTNVHANSRLIVQQRWLRDGLSKMLGVDPSRFIVAPPQRDSTVPAFTPRSFSLPTFFYASTPDCHKNFETLIDAAAMLERDAGTEAFRVVITISGTENRYARFLRRRAAGVRSVIFEGHMDSPRLFATYEACTCFVFPSKVETWGLPISECMPFGKPMILADLPYAHETAAGADAAAFFKPDDATALMRLMREVTDGQMPSFRSVPPSVDTDVTSSWHTLFKQLLSV